MYLFADAISDLIQVITLSTNWAVSVSIFITAVILAIALIQFFLMRSN